MTSFIPLLRRTTCFILTECRISGKGGRRARRAKGSSTLYVDSVDPVAHKLAGPAAVRHDHRLQAVRADGQRARHAGGGGRGELQGRRGAVRRAQPRRGRGDSAPRGGGGAGAGMGRDVRPVRTFGARERCACSWFGRGRGRHLATRPRLEHDDAEGLVAGRYAHAVGRREEPLERVARDGPQEAHRVLRTMVMSFCPSRPPPLSLPFPPQHLRARPAGGGARTCTLRLRAEASRPSCMWPSPTNATTTSGRPLTMPGTASMRISARAHDRSPAGCAEVF